MTADPARPGALDEEAGSVDRWRRDPITGQRDTNTADLAHADPMAADAGWRCRHGYEIDRRCWRCVIGWPWRWVERRRNGIG